MDEERARALLELAAGADAPRPRVNISTARRVGLHRIRVRRAGLAGGPAVAAVAAVALLSTVAAPAGQQHGHRGPAATATTVQAPKRFNPLIPYATFGWLPSGVRLRGGQTAPIRMFLTAGRGTNAWALTVYAAGRCHPGSTDLIRALRRHQHPVLTCILDNDASWSGQVTALARPVAGQHAFWTTRHGSLLWEFAPRSWAVLVLSRARTAQHQAIAIARHVQFGAAKSPSLRFPVQLTAVPAAWKVASTSFVADGSLLRASQFSVPGTGRPSFFSADLAQRTLSCYVYPDGESKVRRINGYLVTVTHLAASRGNPAVQQVCAAHAKGLFVFLSTYGHPKLTATAIFARHLRLLGRDQANWTTRPIR